MLSYGPCSIMSAKTPRPARPESRKSRVQAQPARAAAGRSGRTTVAAVALLLLAVAVLYREIVFEGKIFFASDNQAATSFAAVGKSQLASGSYPVWNPFLFSGMPSYGSLAYTPYVYPVNYVLSILVRYLFFPQYTWLLFHTFLTGLGTFLLAAFARRARRCRAGGGRVHDVDAESGGGGCERPRQPGLRRCVPPVRPLLLGSPLARPRAGGERRRAGDHAGAVDAARPPADLVLHVRAGRVAPGLLRCRARRRWVARS